MVFGFQVSLSLNQCYYNKIYLHPVLRIRTRNFLAFWTALWIRIRPDWELFGQAESGSEIIVQNPDLDLTFLTRKSVPRV